MRKFTMRWLELQIYNSFLLHINSKRGGCDGLYGIKSQTNGGFGTIIGAGIECHTSIMVIVG